MRYILITWIKDPNSHVVYEKIGKHIFLVRKYGKKCLENCNGFENLEEVRKCAEESWHCNFIQEFNDIKELDKIFMAIELLK